MENSLAKLVSFQSITGQPQASHEIIDYITDFVRQRGMHVQRYISNGLESLVATTQPNDKAPTVLLAAHADVVSAPDEMFALRVEDGKYIGRGVLDMKCSLAVFLQIIDELQPDLHNYSLGLMVTTDEEQGGRDGAKKIMQEGYQPKVCILPDGGENWQIQTSAKGMYSLVLTAHGTSVHSSQHWKGVNAISALLPVIPRLEALFPEQGPDSNSLSITMFKAGTNLTQVPNKASLTLDVRTISTSEHIRILKEIEALCSEFGLDLENISDGDPTQCDLANPYIAPFVSLVERTIGITVTGSRTLGSSDIRYLSPHGIPCISFYPTGGGHHSAEEWVSVEAVEHMLSIIRQYIMDTARI
jgi:succinyl-diaminopimelate desuccinylase